MSQSFVHLHCHSHYSLLDGAGPIPKLVTRAKEHGMNALALTDHGNLHGALQFYNTCKANEINPIIGYEAYIAPGSRLEKSGGMKGSNYHLTLLAQNKTGFKNLIKLASAAYLEGFYFKPRIDKELLEKYHEGIICLSGCVSSEFSKIVMRGTDTAEVIKEATDTAGWFQKLFGERYFVEIMNNGLDIQKMQLDGAVDVANKLGLPLVATSDTHYVDQSDAEAQDILLCVNTGKFRTDASRMKMENDQFYLRSPDDMYASFPGLEDACSRSQEIADTVDIDLELGKRHFPSFKIPGTQTADEYLRELCIQGLKERYQGNDEMLLPSGELSEVVMARLDRELGVISRLGFPNYFLIVWDFVVEARKQNIPATARGSGVGAIVCYALYMSHVCPIKYDLLFERFLDENRLEAPDIDIDFDKERRGMVIKYVKEKYGEANVAQIGTFGTLAARAAIKDVGRAMGLPLDMVNEVTGMVPDQLGIKLKAALEQSEEMQAAYNANPDIRELLDLAMKIEGLARNVGTHAAAVVIADEPLTEYVPLCRVSGKEDIITQWSMNDVEAAGLLKMDFLGLRNLTILRNAIDLIKKVRGEDLDILRLPLDDKASFDLLRRGETKGVFQLESGGIRDLLKRMKPDSFLDIIATNALYRPGPLEGGMVDDYIEVKHGRKEAVYKHQVLKDVLEETNGVMVYQEQVMRILNRLGGIPLAKAYTCIKAISKKKESIIQANREQFLVGAQEKGLTKQEATDFWDMIVKFAGYGFNKSHSTAYALVAYQTAYLKAHYPIEFMAALLSGDISGRNFKTKDSLVEHMEDAERMNIEVAPPDVNHSDEEFTVKDGKIVFALSAIKGCGGGAAEAIVAAREKDGPFTDIYDFCERVDHSQCSKAAIETLIKAGAFDNMGGTRAQYSAALDKAIQSGASALADKKSGQKNLFAAVEDTAEAAKSVVLPDVQPWPDKEKLAYEKECLGFYWSSHPLAEYSRKFEMCCSHRTSNLAGVKDKTEVTLGGMVSSIKLAHTRKARPGSTHTKYANFDLEDVDGGIRCIMWPEDYAKMGEQLRPDGVYIVSGRLDRRGNDDEANLIVNELIPIEEVETRYARGVMVRVDEKTHGESTLGTLVEIVRGYPGNCELRLMLVLGDGRQVALRSKKGVDLSPEMRNRVDELLGEGNFELLLRRPANGGVRNSA
ncbi:DNA polymerase III subunit alpha [Blastopirellula marina]|uniref:DNA polymerase III subunit alpha n=1 Tax=Blastopirellula marina TaxID=124 RepID=A0A2S8FHT6_9BACT|nr:DNA polymerase III subunit alpha [Blastopirellula marina]PQO31712.1 DNA polymerase III subunit alpha [Blastopirellula marina]PTL43019.1 DNA polymerase III subunit alpha [Blastopirellula marina]